ncbi:RNA polymerase sigma factor [Cryobacterium algoricola]|uniref:RNA polymerase sigma factor n=1 Tax=Cryobacterium algoricola TaxID=1259183 RepID=UPI001F54787F|nr:sigma-70 family RNA polymerase sigma factor [Cryobacterium algoricola]
MSRPPDVASEGSAERRLEDLHEQLAGDLLRYFARRVTPPADAADLLAETLMVAWRRLDKVPTDDQGARMWMFATARRVLANWTRGQRRRTALTDELRTRLIETPQPDASAEVLDVRRALEDLPRNQRELIRLVHWDGFSIIDAARLTGIRESTARGRYQRAKAQLKARLAESPGLPTTTAPTKVTTP